jgi:sugar O-acyltransferase (sialic acid O-acetyltransferase NeuD family)
MTRNSTEPIALIGAGGHAKVVISTLRAMGRTVGAVFDDDQRKWQTTLLGVSVRGPIAAVAETDYRAAIITIGDNGARQRLSGELKNLEWLTAIHPQAYVDPSARIAGGSVVFAGAAIQPDVIIGSHVIVNTGATVDHDCVLGDYVHLAPGARLAGGVRIGRGSFLGVGAVVIPYRRVGDWATIGAGGVVVKDIADNVTAVGVPARPLKREL